jgi:prepilin-type N-terminal cleavage/methylation domain-containing protein
MSIEKQYRQQGFTLVELSIVIVILGILIAALLQTYAVFDKKQRVEVTKDNTKAAYMALAAYKANKGFYPCPASPLDTAGKASNCNNTSPPAGITSVTSPDGREVWIGVMPVLDNTGEHKLIMSTGAVDGWNKRLTYAVTRNLANGTIVTTPNAGGITMIDAATGSTTANVDFVLFSHGENGAGAFSADGSGHAPCSTGLRDSENCNGDAVFVTSSFSYADSAEYNDDYTEYAKPEAYGCTIYFDENGAYVPNGKGENMYTRSATKPAHWSPDAAEMIVTDYETGQRMCVNLRPAPPPPTTCTGTPSGGGPGNDNSGGNATGGGTSSSGGDNNSSAGW